MWNLVNFPPKKRIKGTFHKEIFRGREVINFNCQILISVGYFREFDWHRKIPDRSFINFNINKHQITLLSFVYVNTMHTQSPHGMLKPHGLTPHWICHAVLAICQTYFTTLKIYFSFTISNYLKNIYLH